MKKLVYILSVAVVAAMACSKEEAVIPEGNVPSSGEKYVLFAELPQFTDANTKAAVSDAGVFSWTAGDEINVTFEKSGVGYHNWVLTCTDASTGEFTYQGEGTIPDGYNPRAGYYPKDYTGNPSSQTFDTPADAAKGFQMEATVSGGKLVFAHENAMMKVTISHVPSFAKQIVVGGTKINVSYTSNQESVTYYVPVIAAAESQLSIAVKDGTAAAANDIIAKSSKKEVEIEASNFYNLPTLAIGPVVIIKNNTLAEATAGGHPASDMPGNIDYYIGTGNFNDNNLKSITINATDYVYYVYPASDYGTTQDVTIHHDDYDYPRVVTAVKLDNYEQFYNFGYTTGLRRVENTGYTFYVYSQDKTNVDLYVWDPSELFGSWNAPDASLKGYMQTGNDDSANRIYYFDLTGITTYSFKLHNGNTDYCGDQSNVSVSGNVYWAVYSNGGGTWNYTQTGFDDDGLPDWIYKW